MAKRKQKQGEKSKGAAATGAPVRTPAAIAEAEDHVRGMLRFLG